MILALRDMDEEPDKVFRLILHLAARLDYDGIKDSEPYFEWRDIDISGILLRK